MWRLFLILQFIIILNFNWHLILPVNQSMPTDQHFLRNHHAFRIFPHLMIALALRHCCRCCCCSKSCLVSRTSTMTSRETTRHRVAAGAAAAAAAARPWAAGRAAATAALLDTAVRRGWRRTCELFRSSVTCAVKNANKTWEVFFQLIINRYDGNT